MHMFTIVPLVYKILSSIKFFYYFVTKFFNAGALSYVGEGLTTSSNNPLDFHSEIWSLLLILSKYLFTGWNTKISV